MFFLLFLALTDHYYASINSNNVIFRPLHSRSGPISIIIGLSHTLVSVLPYKITLLNYYITSSFLCSSTKTSPNASCCSYNTEKNWGFHLYL